MRTKVGLFGFGVCAMCLCTTGFGSEQETDMPSPKLRWEYAQSVDAPSGLAFEAFADVVNHELAKSRQSAIDFLVFALDLPDDFSSRELADRLVDVIHHTSWLIDLEKNSSEIANYCSQGLEHRPNDEVFDAMDRQDDLYVEIANRHYAIMLGQLDPATRSLVSARTEKHKTSSSFASMSHKEGWEAVDPNPDMQSILADICQVVHAEQAKLARGR